MSKKPWNAGKDLFPELTDGPRHVQPPLPKAPPLQPSTSLVMSPRDDVERKAPLTDEQRETLCGCAACMEALCEVCGHEPCPGCGDDCDHPDCITWNEDDSGDKTHVCVFARCPKHRELVA